VIGLEHLFDFSSALCAQTDPTLFFPKGGDSAVPARELCLGCPCRLDCLWEAVERREGFGVWGGLNQEQLRMLWRSPVQGCELPPGVAKKAT
jgi:WhiB family redox-sensing transcriptional regulator